MILTSIDKLGPAGALIAYGIIGFIVFWVTFSLGEMATYIPVRISKLDLMFTVIYLHICMISFFL